MHVHVLDAMRALYTADDLSSTVISQSLAVVTRLLAEDSGCTHALATHKTVAMLKQVVETCPKDPTTLYHVAVALYHFAAAGPPARQATALADSVFLLGVLSHQKDCLELVTLSMCHYLLDPKVRAVQYRTAIHGPTIGRLSDSPILPLLLPLPLSPAAHQSRHAFTNRDIAATIIRVMDSHPSDDVTCNAISCLFALSRRANCRDFLTEGPLHADMHLLKLSQSDDPKIKANCARTLKNLTSDSSEALEEGM
jgi:hypothetical protein